MQERNLPKLIGFNEINLGSTSIFQNYSANMVFVQTECNLLKLSHFVKKIVLNIKLIKFPKGKGKINENLKKGLKEKKKKQDLA